MLTGLDHVIIGTRHLQQATQQFQDQIGLSASGGGNHPKGGTANRIIVIGDTYLELIGIHTPEEAQESMRLRLKQGEGYLNCVFASNALYQDSTAMAERGIQLVGPQPGELKAVDGSSRGWIRTDIERPDLAQRYPFLIQHDSHGAERRRRLAGGITPPIHPLGAIRVISTTLAVKNLAEASQRFQHIYGLQPEAAEMETYWGAQIIAFPLGNGTQFFELAEPESLAAPLNSEQRGLTTHLQQFGESLYRMTLGVESLDKARRYLEAHNTGYTYQAGEQSAIWIRPEETCGAAIVLKQT